jgi:hypothetical protein
MLRVRDEEEFLAAAVRSIASCVDEIVIVDNLSRDATPGIIEALAAELPGKIVSFHYTHEVRRVGQETWEQSEGDANSPHLSSSYYNWCLERCTQPYVLKWDGDMLALDGFAESVSRWRRSQQEVLVMHGANVHPDRAHLISARTREREPLLEQLRVPGLPRWVTSLTYDYPEPRLFPRVGARYHSDLRWTQSLASPCLGDGREGCIERAEGPQYLHMKFVKRDPYANYSPDLAAVIAGNIARGPVLDAAMRETLRRLTAMS